MRHKASVVARYLLIIVGSWFVMHSLSITVDGLTDVVQPADCLVVPGNTVNPDGSLSDRLRGRLDKAVALYQGGSSPVIFVSGGLGQEGHYEGTAMQAYLVAQGVPAAAVVIDNAGNNTLATACHFAELSRQRHFSSVLVVSQFFHISRTKMLLRQHHTGPIYSAHANYFEWRDAYALVREFFAYYAYYLASSPTCGPAKPLPE